LKISSESRDEINQNIYFSDTRDENITQNIDFSKIEKFKYKNYYLLNSICCDIKPLPKNEI